MNPREIPLRVWVRSLLRHQGVNPEPGEVSLHVRRLRFLDGQIKAASERDRPEVVRVANQYAATIGVSAPHLDMDAPGLPLSDVLVTRAQHQMFAE